MVVAVSAMFSREHASLRPLLIRREGNGPVREVSVHPIGYRQRPGRPVLITDQKQTLLFT